MDMLLPSRIECEYEKKTLLLCMQCTHRCMKPQQTHQIMVFHHIYVKSYFTELPVSNISKNTVYIVSKQAYDGTLNRNMAATIVSEYSSIAELIDT